jgi:hypothetical protein
MGLGETMAAYILCCCDFWDDFDDLVAKVLGLVVGGDVASQPASHLELFIEE